MFRLSRKDTVTGKITHSIEQNSNVLKPDNVKDWDDYGPYDLITVDISQELSDKAQKEQEKIDALSRIKLTDMAAVTTLPALIEIVKDLVKIVKGE